MKRAVLFLFAALATCTSAPAFAQSTFSTAQGGRVAGVVPMQCDANGQNCTYAGDPAAPPAGAQQVQGTAAGGTPATGNPVLVAGSDGTNARTLATGLSGGMLIGTLGGSNTAVVTAVNGDTIITSTQSGLVVNSRGVLFDGATWVRARGSSDGAFTVTTPTTAATNAIVPGASAAVTGAVTAKAAAGNLYRVVVTTGGSAGYLMGFNATTPPADGAVTPSMCRTVAANSTLSVSYADMPARWSTGISFAFSTTGCFTKTVSATAYFEWSVM